MLTLRTTTYDNNTANISVDESFTDRKHLDVILTLQDMLINIERQDDGGYHMIYVDNYGNIVKESTIQGKDIHPVCECIECEFLQRKKEDYTYYICNNKCSDHFNRMVSINSSACKFAKKKGAKK